MQYEDFEDNQLQFVQNWVRLNTEGYDSHGLEDSEEKDEEGGGLNLIIVRLLFHATT